MTLLKPSALLLAGLLLVACGAPGGRPAAAANFVLGVLLPLHGDQATLAGEELSGVKAAVAEVNHRGGVHGRNVSLVIRDVTTREAAVAAVDGLRRAGASVVLGGYSSMLSIPAAHATHDAGLVYWETGAVADQLTGEALRGVFRVGAAGTNLGRGSATFAAEQLAPRLGRSVKDLRVTLVAEHDPYGDSVVDSARTEAARRGMQVAATVNYSATSPDWPSVLDAVAASRPDVLILASYIPDGVAFRRAMLNRHLKVGALIGSTMAECGPVFGQMLGADAIGVFASDRPTRGFNPGALDASGAAAYKVLTDAYRARYGREAGEEAISGFSSAWALLADVVPGAASLQPSAITDAAFRVDLPAGSLPNGGGLKFSTGSGELGQNSRAASVVWQWQGVNRSVTVWPPVFATGEVEMVPLPR